MVDTVSSCTALQNAKIIDCVKRYLIEQRKRPGIYNKWKQQWMKYISSPTQDTMSVYTQQCIDADNAFNEIYNNVQTIQQNLMQLHTVMSNTATENSESSTNQSCDTMIESVIERIETIERLEESHLEQYTELQAIQHQYLVQLKQPHSSELSEQVEKYRTRMNEITEQISNNVEQLNKMITGSD